MSRSGCKYTSSSAVSIAAGQRCSCCGRLRFAPKPCGLPQTLPEFELSPIVKKTPLNETISCEETELPCDRTAVIVNSKNHSCETSSLIICGDKGLKACEYTEEDVRRFVEIIEQKLAESLRRNKLSACADFEVYGGENEVGCSGERIEGKLKGSRTEDRTLVCPNSLITCGLPEAVIRDYCEISSRTDAYQQSIMENQCWSTGGVRYCEFQKVENGNVECSKESTERSIQEDICTFCEPTISENEKDEEDSSLEDFEIVSDARTNSTINADFIKSQDFCKWGELDAADRILAAHEKVGTNVTRRFSCMDRKCFSTLCRQLFRWSYRLSKKWRDLTRRPHVVIHLPSMGYPAEIRRRASARFDLLQNVQVTRLGWLANENAQVVYVVPNDQGVETITLFRNLIKNVRPDVAENRLWIIQPEGEKCFKTGCLNGSRALFQSTKTFQRLQMLTAGRRAFLLPGVMEEVDVFIASKLRAPVMGPPLEFQNYFLKKSNVANFLKEIDVDQPPFVPDVRNFSELCQGLAHLTITYPRYATWLMKINYGFNGLQTGSINFEKSPSREIIAAKKRSSKTAEVKRELTAILMKIIPDEINLNKLAYKSSTEFFNALQKYGGLVQASPHTTYEVVTLGVFLEDDTSTPTICASADVFHLPEDIAVDLGYGLPQTTTARLPIENLAIKVGIALREQQYIGYFGIDLVITRSEKDSNIEKILVVDIDPHYTDVIAFTDWVKFCLGTATATTRRCGRHSCQSGILECDKNENDMKKRRTSKKRKKILNPKESMERYAICSGQICSNGLARYCGSTLVSLCEERNVRYNFKMKQGSMICPIDSERRALGLVSLHPKRFRAIEEFAKALRVLHEISMGKPNENIKTNMLKFARALEKQLELKMTRNEEKIE